MRRGAPLGRQVIIRLKHVIGFGDGQRRIVDDREIRRGAAEGLDVFLPLGVVLHRIDRHADHARRPLGKFARKLGHRPELGRADRGEVARVRKDDAVVVAEPVVEVNFSGGGLGNEIGGNVVDADGHGLSFRWDALAS